MRLFQCVNILMIKQQNSSAPQPRFASYAYGYNYHSKYSTTTVFESVSIGVKVTMPVTTDATIITWQISDYGDKLWQNCMLRYKICT